MKQQQQQNQQQQKHGQGEHNVGDLAMQWCIPCGCVEAAAANFYLFVMVTAFVDHFAAKIS